VDFYLVTVLSLLVLVSPLYFAVLLTSRLSIDAKIIVGFVSLVLLTLLPLIFFLFQGGR
jgi:hypothetical protein